MIYILLITALMIAGISLAWAIYETKRANNRRPFQSMPIYFDMDGVLAKWREVPFEATHVKGFFLAAKVDMQILVVVKTLLQLGYDVRILTAAYNRRVIKEKKAWLKKEAGLKCLTRKRNFKVVPYNTPKVKAVRVGILVDDYSQNLREWQVDPYHKAMKYYNGKNGKKRTWKGNFIACNMSPEEMVQRIISMAMQPIV